MRYVESAARGMRGVAGALLIVIAAMIVTDVVVRYITGRSVPGVIEYSEIALIGVAYLAFSHAEITRAHIRVDSVTRVMPPPVRRWAYAVSHLAIVGVLLCFVWVTGVEAWESYTIGEVRLGTVYAPVWPARAMIPLGYASLALMFLATTIEKVRNVDLFSRTENVEPEVEAASRQV